MAWFSAEGTPGVAAELMSVAGLPATGVSEDMGYTQHRAAVGGEGRGEGVWVPGCGARPAQRGAHAMPRACHTCQAAHAEPARHLRFWGSCFRVRAAEAVTASSSTESAASRMVGVEVGRLRRGCGGGELTGADRRLGGQSCRD